MANARQTAFNALLKIEKNNAYSNIALDSMLTETKLDTRDKSFVSALFYGVIERKLTIDFVLQKYLSKPLKKLKPEALTILRMGAYQILFMDKIPKSAAVNESVTLSRKNNCSYASGIINAVLRKVSRDDITIKDRSDVVKFLSITYSCPENLVRLLIDQYGADDAEGILSHTIGTAELYVRVNTTKITEDELIELLCVEGVKADKTYLKNALVLNLNGKDIESLDSFRKGLYHVQDLSCQLCSAALRAENDMRVFDLCSAPGGKAYTVAEIMEDSGEVLCFDIHKNRVELIRKGAVRLGLSAIKPDVSDASVYNKSLGLADRVLCDVPCSGLGIIGRKPEIKYKSLDEFKSLPNIQLKILSNGAEYVRNGGLIIYSTCTLSKQENEGVCKDFLKANKDFEAVKPLPEISDDKFVTLMPHKNGGDGFFIAAFRKKDDINE